MLKSLRIVRFILLSRTVLGLLLNLYRNAVLDILLDGEIRSQLLVVNFFLSVSLISAWLCDARLTLFKTSLSQSSMTGADITTLTLLLAFTGQVEELFPPCLGIASLKFEPELYELNFLKI